MGQQLHRLSELYRITFNEYQSVDCLLSQEHSLVSERYYSFGESICTSIFTAMQAESQRTDCSKRSSGRYSVE